MSVPDFNEPQIAEPGKVGAIFAGPDAVIPDHSKSRKMPPGVQKAMGKLGNNKKARGGPRALKEDDIQKIEDYYYLLGVTMMPFKPAVTNAINEPVGDTSESGDSSVGSNRAHMCALAWYELANQNDSVRRVLLMFIEGGAWSAVFMANLPILMAALPDDALSRIFARIMPAPHIPDSVPEDWQNQNGRSEGQG